MSEFMEEDSGSGELQMLEESHFFYVITQFEELVEQYGVSSVIEELGYPVYEAIEEYMKG